MKDEVIDLSDQRNSEVGKIKLQLKVKGRNLLHTSYTYYINKSIRYHHPRTICTQDLGILGLRIFSPRIRCQVCCVSWCVVMEES